MGENGKRGNRRVLSEQRDSACERGRILCAAQDSPRGCTAEREAASNLPIRVIRCTKRSVF